MIDVETVEAAPTTRLLEAIEATYPLLTMIMFFSTMRVITMRFGDVTLTGGYG
jgi:hypothetical protein